MEERLCLGCMKMTRGGNVCEHCGFVAEGSNESHQLPPGTEISGKYIVGKVLGQGGFGITYLGWDKYMETPVAIKEFYPSTLITRDSAQSTHVFCSMEFNVNNYLNSKARFLREAKALTKFSYVPQIVQIKGFFEENDTAYIVMEYVKGKDLRHYINLRGGRLTMKETMAVLAPVMDALAIVHEEGLIHRDISPDNLMLDPMGGAKLLDFGAVRSVEAPEVEKELTKSTEAILKHGFAPPEQYRNRGSLGPWTDVYALCATIYYCLTGRVPTESLARMMGDGEIDWESIPGLTPQERRALRKGMELKAKDRFASVKELKDALLSTEEIAEEPVQPVQPPVQKKKSKAWIGIVAAVLAVALLGGGWFAYSSGLLPFGAQEPEITLQEPEATEPVMEPAQTLPAETQPAETVPEETVPETEAPTMPQGQVLQAEEIDGAWLDNLMCSNPLDKMGDVNRTQIVVVLFHDTMEQAPKDWGYDLSEAKDLSVKGWIDGNGALNIAAEGGINGANATAKMFENCINLRSVTFGNAFHTEQATSMKSMFDSCRALEEADVENLNTSRVSNMNRMFYGCATLKKLDVSGWDMGSVTNLNLAFYNCISLPELDVSNWNTESLRDMNSTFMGCTALTTLPVDNWNMSSVQDLGSAFRGCTGLEQLPVGAWDVSSVTDLSSAFHGCTKLKKLDVANWNVGRVTTLRETFHDCRDLAELDVSNWQTKRVTDMYMTFAGIYAMKEIPVGKWDVSKVTEYMNFMGSEMKINGEPWRNYFEK